MQIVSNKDDLIFRRDYNGKPKYALSISKKDTNGNYVNGYINVHFRKNVELKNKTKIRVSDGWLDFYKDNDKTIPTLFINEFKIVKEGEDEVVKEVDPYKEMNVKVESDIGKEIRIEDDDLPF